MRGRPTSMVWTSPSAAGMTWNRSSTATPTVVQSHITALATVANIASGTGRPGIFAFPCAHRDQHQDAPDPRTCNDQHQPDVEPGACRERRIEREQHRSLADPDRDQRHHDAEDRHPECGPRPWPARKRTVERRDRDEISKAHDEERRQHIGHRDAMRRHRHEILTRRADMAPSGLRTHICHVPRTHAAEKAAKATQKCARQSRSAFRTGNSPVRIRLELVFR